MPDVLLSQRQEKSHPSRNKNLNTIDICRNGTSYDMRVRDQETSRLPKKKFFYSSRWLKITSMRFTWQGPLSRYSQLKGRHPDPKKPRVKFTKETQLKGNIAGVPLGQYINTVQACPGLNVGSSSSTGKSISVHHEQLTSGGS